MIFWWCYPWCAVLIRKWSVSSKGTFSSRLCLSSSKSGGGGRKSDPPMSEAVSHPFFQRDLTYHTYGSSC